MSRSPREDFEGARYRVLNQGTCRQNLFAVGRTDKISEKKRNRGLKYLPYSVRVYQVFTFIEHPTFTKQAQALFSDDEYRRFQVDLAAMPEARDVIPGLAAGLRKIRWGAKGKGKRGGARIIYLLIPDPGIVYLFSAYTKGDIEDMTNEQKKRLAKAVTAIKAEYRK